MGIRVILQTKDDRGLVFDASGVREVSVQDAWIYMDGKPCYLLVSADGRMTFPSPDFAFCTVTRLLISTDLVTMERRNGSTSRADVVFVTPRIANIVAEVQQEQD